MLYNTVGQGDNRTVPLVSYDDNGNILSVSDGTNTTSYVYDSQNQLIWEKSEATGYATQWEYNNAGNIVKRKVYDYDSSVVGELIDTVNYYYQDDKGWGDLLTSYDGRTINYDGMGNPLNDGQWNYTWKNGRELASMTKGNTTWTYTYDAGGMRTRRTDGQYDYVYEYNGSQLVSMSVDGYTQYFYYDANGIPLSLTINNYHYYYVTNLQGDVIGILDETGEQVATYFYSAWGEVECISDDPVADYNPLTYRGYVYDWETGLYYLQSRYYNPEWGRFINGDCYNATGQGFIGNNMFAYCLNNPTNRNDSTGYWSLWNSIKNGWNKFTNFVSDTFGCGVIQSNKYKAFQFETIMYGNEGGDSTTGVISGDVSKLVSVYFEQGTEWWKFVEYKVGVQINIRDGGFSYSTNTLERSITISGKNNSLELMEGINKIGYTYRSGVSFKNRTAEHYYHEYIRSVPTAAVVLACYYTAGAAIPAIAYLLQRAY